MPIWSGNCCCDPFVRAAGSVFGRRVAGLGAQFSRQHAHPRGLNRLRSLPAAGRVSRARARNRSRHSCGTTCWTTPPSTSSAVTRSRVGTGRCRWRTRRVRWPGTAAGDDLDWDARGDEQLEGDDEDPVARADHDAVDPVTGRSPACGLQQRQVGSVATSPSTMTGVRPRPLDLEDVPAVDPGSDDCQVVDRVSGKAPILLEVAAINRRSTVVGSPSRLSASTK